MDPVTYLLGNIVFHVVWICAFLAFLAANDKFWNEEGKRFTEPVLKVLGCALGLSSLAYMVHALVSPLI